MAADYPAMICMELFAIIPQVVNAGNALRLVLVSFGQIITCKKIFIISL
jgi:hypothetical protein